MDWKDLEHHVQDTIQNWNQVYQNKVRALQSTVLEAQQNLQRIQLEYAGLQGEMDEFLKGSPETWKGVANYLPSWITTVDELRLLPSNQVTPALLNQVLEAIEQELEVVHEDQVANVSRSNVQRFVKELRSLVGSWTQQEVMAKKQLNESKSLDEQMRAASASLSNRIHLHKEWEEKQFQLKMTAVQMDQLQSKALHVLSSLRLEYIHGSMDPIQKQMAETKSWLQRLVSGVKSWFHKSSSRKKGQRTEQMESLREKIQTLEANLTQYKDIEQRALDRAKERADVAAARWSEIVQVLQQDQEQFQRAWDAYQEKLSWQDPEAADDLSEWPVPGSALFATDLLRVLPFEDFGTKVPQTLNQSRCGTGPKIITGYQRTVGELMQPKLRDLYYGLFLDYIVGAGKTLAMLQSVLQYKTQMPDADVLVLLPSTKLIATWTNEIKSTPGLAGGIDVQSTDTTTQLTWQDDGFRVVLHWMLAALPENVFQDWDPDGQQLPTIQARMLAAQNYEDNDIYESLTLEQKRMLNKQLRSTADKILKNQTRFTNNRKVALPPKGIVFVDEAPFLVDPSSLLTRADQSNCVLAWAMCLKYSSHVPRVLASGTPLTNEYKTMDLVKLLNLTKNIETSEFVLPEGNWRRVLSLKAQREERAAAGGQVEDSSLSLVAQYAEETFLKKWFNSNKWFVQRASLGSWSWITLEHDPTIYPQLDRSCVLEDRCLLQYQKVPKKGFELVQVPNVTARTTPKDGLTEILVPLSQEVFKKYVAAAKQDLSRFGDTRQLGCEDVHPRCLDYSKNDLKTALTKGWGFKDSSKFLIVRYLLNQYTNEKFWIASGARTYVEFGKPFIKFFNDFHIFGLPEALELVLKSKHREVGAMVDEWYQQHTPQKRMVFFGSSTQMANLDKMSSLAERNKVSDEMLLSVLLSLNNHAQNQKASHFQAFVGDVRALTGISLLDTKNVILMEPSINASMQEQTIARAKRYCSMSRDTNIQNWRIRVFVLVATVPVATVAESTAKTVTKKSKPQDAMVLLLNEQYQRSADPEQKEEESADVFAKILLETIRFASGDCLLTASYNQAPGGRAIQCFVQDADEEEEEDDAPRLKIAVRKTNDFLVGGIDEIARLDFHGQYQLHADMRLPKNVETSDDYRLLEFGLYSPLDRVVERMLDEEMPTTAGVQPVQAAVYLLENTSNLKFDLESLEQLQKHVEDLGPGGVDFMKYCLPLKTLYTMHVYSHRFPEEVSKDILTHSILVGDELMQLYLDAQEARNVAHDVQNTHKVEK